MRTVRPARTVRTGERLAALWWASLLALVMGAAGTLRAQIQPEADAVPGAATPQPVDPLDITGRDFAGLRLPVAEVSGAVSFRAMRGWVWSETGTVHRMFLSGDVSVELGLYHFDAAQAVVWLQRDDSGVYQVFVYFDRVGSAEADATITVSADRLSVQARIVPDRPVQLTLDSRREGRADEPFVVEAERTLAAYLTELVQGPGTGAWPARQQPAARLGGGGAGFGPGERRPPAQEVSPLPTTELERLADSLPPAAHREPVFAEQGLFSFVPGSLTFVSGAEESAAILDDGIAIQYWDRESDRTLQLTAQRAVVFLAPGPLRSLVSMERDAVRGIYLEGDVQATDGQYTVRGPRVYYDVQRGRAVIVDAVFWMYDERLGLPLYVRAKTIRQESAEQFSASSATLTNTAFFEPQLAIGTSTVTLTRSEGAQSRMRNIVDARDITLRVEDIPVFYWPRYRGDPTQVPIRDLTFESSSASGGAIKTTWDLLSLSGLEAPEWADAELFLDAYFDRGAGFGGKVTWDRPEQSGSINAYTLPYDTGIDKFPSGAEIDRDGEFRGILLADQRWALDDKWTVLAEGSLISDEAFVEAMFPRLAQTRREFTTRLYARRVEDRSALTFQAKGTLNDFTPNQYLMQSQGYMVDKLPEARYLRLADDLLPDSSPGMLSYSSDTRVTRMQMRFVGPTAAELGFDTPARARIGLGILPDQTLADALRAEGYTGRVVHRFDTRHELNSKFDVGPMRLTPFATGRLTLYDDTFDAFAPESDDTYRFFGALGTRVATTITKTDNSIESRVFDLHRVRHVIEPNATFWVAGASVDQADLPVYDDSVESLADGAVAKIGLNQTFQTQRGGPGRWRSVDFLTLNAEAVISSEDADPESPIGRFFDYRPEYSVLGDYATLEATWQATDALALVAGTIHDFETEQQARTVLGYILRHSPAFSTYADFRYVNAMDSTYLTVGAAYRLTSKYDLDGNVTYDDDEKTIQAVDALVTRRFPSAMLGIGVRYDNISGETSLSVVLHPGGRTGALGLTGIGGSRGRAGSSGFGG